MRLRVGVDVDGVLADQLKAAIELLRKQNMGLNTNPEDIVDWHFKIDDKLDIADSLKMLSRQILNLLGE